MSPSDHARAVDVYGDDITAIELATEMVVPPVDISPPKREYKLEERPPTVRPPRTPSAIRRRALGREILQRVPRSMPESPIRRSLRRVFGSETDLQANISLSAQMPHMTPSMIRKKFRLQAPMAPSLDPVPAPARAESPAERRRKRSSFTLPPRGSENAGSAPNAEWKEVADALGDFVESRKSLIEGTTTIIDPQTEESLPTMRRYSDIVITPLDLQSSEFPPIPPPEDQEDATPQDVAGAGEISSSGRKSPRPRRHRETRSERNDRHTHHRRSGSGARRGKRNSRRTLSHQESELSTQSPPPDDAPSCSEHQEDSPLSTTSKSVGSDIIPVVPVPPSDQVDATEERTSGGMSNLEGCEGTKDESSNTPKRRHRAPREASGRAVRRSSRTNSLGRKKGGTSGKKDEKDTTASSLPKPAGRARRSSSSGVADGRVLAAIHASIALENGRLRPLVAKGRSTSDEGSRARHRATDHSPGTRRRLEATARTTTPRRRVKCVHKQVSAEELLANMPALGF